MRGGFEVELAGERSALVGIESWLQSNGYRSHRTGSSPDAETGTVPLVRLRHLQDDLRIGELPESSRGNDEQVATAALIPSGAASCLPMALALGLDDVLLFPGDDALLIHQLDRLSELTLMRREAGLRGDAGRSMSPNRSRSPAKKALTDLTRAPLRVLIVGPPAQPKVRLAEALGKAIISFADTVAIAKRRLAHDTMDLVVLSVQTERALAALEQWEQPQERSAPHTIALLDTSLLDGRDPVAWMSQRGISDIIAPDMPTERLRLRLEHWHQVCVAKRRLVDVHGSILPEVAQDAATGLPTLDFLIAYLDARRDSDPERPTSLIAFRLVDLWRVAESFGYAMATELLAEMGHRVSQAVRLLDLVAYCGNGRVVVAVDVADRVTAESIADRVARRVEEQLSKWLNRPLEIEPNVAAPIGSDVAASIETLINATEGNTTGQPPVNRVGSDTVLVEN